MTSIDKKTEELLNPPKIKTIYIHKKNNHSNTKQEKLKAKV